MRATCAVVLLALLLVLPWPSHALDPLPQSQYLWALYDLAPGRDTFFADINDAGEIVGNVRGADNVPHAFLLTHFHVRTFTCPNDEVTELTVINTQRMVGGHCFRRGRLGRRAFVTPPLQGTQAPTYDFLGDAADIVPVAFTDIQVRGMNDWGHTVGSWSDHVGGIFEGFWSTGPGGDFVRVQAVVPERPVFNTWFNGINNWHNIVGTYAERPGAPTHGLLSTFGFMATYDVHGARGTSWWDINDALQIVGTAEDADGPLSVLVDAWTGVMQRVDYPDPQVLFTDVTAINNAGVIIGIVALPHPEEPGGVVFKGFVAAPKPASFGPAPAAVATSAGVGAVAQASRAAPPANAAHIAPRTRVRLNRETCTTTATHVIPVKMRAILGCTD